MSERTVLASCLAITVGIILGSTLVYSGLSPLGTWPAKLLAAVSQPAIISTDILPQNQEAAFDYDATSSNADTLHEGATSSTSQVHIPIFIYHSVRPDFPTETNFQKMFSITPEFFESQLSYLKDHGYTVISMDDLVRDVRAGTTSPIVKPVVLTFDDGWKNQFEYAYPLLQKYNVTATFYIYTNPIGRSKFFMNWDQVTELHNAGMTIGDHTITHPYFKGYSSETIKHEVMGGKESIERHLNTKVLHFASPYGFNSPELLKILYDGGFASGRTTYNGSVHDKSTILELDGIMVSRNLNDFIAELK